MPNLSPEKQRHIDQIIDVLKLRIGLGYPENHLLQITEALGIEVLVIDLTKLGDNIDGLIDFNELAPKIYINETFSEERKTFTLAHELGHYLLHDCSKNRFRLDKFDYAQDTIENTEEAEANYFAASLLVPNEKLEKLLLLTHNDLDTASKFFGVAKPVIETKLKWMKKSPTA